MRVESVYIEEPDPDATPSVPGVPSPSVPGASSPSVPGVPSPSTQVAGSSQQSVENQVLLQTVERLISAAQQKGLPYDFSMLSGFVSSGSVKFQTSGSLLRVHDPSCSWDQHYSVLSFLVNGHLFAGHLFADYNMLSCRINSYH